MTEIVFKRNGRNQRIFDAMWRFNKGFWLDDTEPKNTTNLCQWIRVVIIWPFFHSAAFAVSLYALYSAVTFALRELVDPAVSASFWQYVRNTGIIIGVILTVIFTIAFFKHRAEERARIAEEREQQRWRNARFGEDQEAEQETEQETAWHKLILTYLVSLKQQICPTIRYVRNIDEERI